MTSRGVVCVRMVNMSYVHFLFHGVELLVIVEDYWV